MFLSSVQNWHRSWCTENDVWLYVVKRSVRYPLYRFMEPLIVDHQMKFILVFVNCFSKYAILTTTKEHMVVTVCKPYLTALFHVL